MSGEPVHGIFMMSMSTSSVLSPSGHLSQRVLIISLLVGAGVLGACSGEVLKAREPSADTVHFTVQSYNVELLHFGDEDTVTAVGDELADIVVLQEVTPEWEATLRSRYSEQYQHMIFRSEAGSGGLAVLSHFPLSDQGLREGPNGWHPAWHLEVETPAGPLQVLNVHLRSPLTGRDNALDAALSTREDHLVSIELFSDSCNNGVPTLILGDFNEDVNGAAIRFLEGLGFQNALPLYHPGQITWRYRALAGQLDKTLDHILFDDSLVSLNSWVSAAGNSDHFPVLAHFEVSPNW